MREIISIHALREEGDRHRAPCSGILPISIHALREEGDLGAAEVSLIHDISIHALREEGDGVGTFLRRGMVAFLSTPSARRATRDPAVYGRRGIAFLSTPSARRATSRPLPPRNDHPISIHALREEGDELQSADNYRELIFLSTPSARRAT